MNPGHAGQDHRRLIVLGLPALALLLYWRGGPGGFIVHDWHDGGGGDTRLGTGKWGENLSSLYPSPFTLSPAAASTPRDKSWESKLTVVNKFGRPTGTASSWAVHTQGLWHRDVLVVLSVGDKILLQQRAAWKWTYPLMWDVSASESMEGNESFATAATRAVTEELRGLIHIDGGGFRLKAGAVPSLERCCGPRTYIWEGAMEFMQLKEATIVEVWRGNLPPSVLTRNGRSTSAGTDANDAEVAGFRLTTATALQTEASTPAGRRKYGPWLLDALAHCPVCWTA